MPDRKEQPIEGYNKGGTFKRIRRPVGLTLDEKTIEKLDEIVNGYGFNRSRLIDFLVAREHRLWKEGLPCLKDQLMV